MLSNNAYTQEYFDIMESLGGDIESRRAAYDYMKNSTAIVHHQVISTSFVPRLYDRRTREMMRTTVETTHRILCKVIEHYLEDPDYRTIFDYDPRLAELILVPRGYDAVLPFARFDIFLDEETGEVAFCEFNGDGILGHEREPRDHQLARRTRRPSRSSRAATKSSLASSSMPGLRTSSASTIPTRDASSIPASPSATTCRMAS